MSNVPGLSPLVSHGHVVDVDLLPGLDHVHGDQHHLVQVGSADELSIGSAGVVGPGHGGAHRGVPVEVHGIGVELSTVEELIKLINQSEIRIVLCQPIRDDYSMCQPIRDD